MGGVAVRELANSRIADFKYFREWWGGGRGEEERSGRRGEEWKERGEGSEKTSIIEHTFAQG